MNYIKFSATLCFLFLVFTYTFTNPKPIRAQTSSCTPPYAATSPWNQKIPANAQIDAKNAQYVSTLSGIFGSDPTQFTMPVYRVSSSTPLKTITVSGVYSNVTNNGTTLTKTNGAISVPVPSGAKQAAGSDSQIILWNQQTGDEWGFWKASINADGSGIATNGYHYNTNWSGVPPSGFGSRGAGVPYLTGLIMPCEITQGHIDHAIAFAYQNVSSTFVYPATKSDGSGSGFPEGTRLQLDPSISTATIQGWGCTGACLTIAKALQQYGMITIDFAGHPKIYAEYEGTAKWNGVINANTVKMIPYSAFKVLSTSNILPTGTTSISPSTQPTGQTNRTMAVTVFLHGIGRGGDNVSPGSLGNQNPLHTTRQLSITFLNNQNVPSYTKTISILYNSTTGNFQGTQDIRDIPAGIYTIQAKTDLYLGKTLPGIISIPEGVSLVTFPTITLVAGDVFVDNKLNILDYNYIIDCFSELSTPRNCTPVKKTQTDLTDDGNVNQFDYNLFLREMSVQAGG